MRQYLKNWDLMRILRFAGGVIIAIGAAQSKEWLLLVPGLAFMGMAVFNTGCCCVGGVCDVPKQPMRNK